VKDDESFINFELPKKAHVDWIKFLFYKREETPADEKPMKSSPPREASCSTCTSTTS
jgi:hypothetical protein